MPFDNTFDWPCQSSVYCFQPARSPCPWALSSTFSLKALLRTGKESVGQQLRTLLQTLPGQLPSSTARTVSGSPAQCVHQGICPATSYNPHILTLISLGEKNVLCWSLTRDGKAAFAGKSWADTKTYPNFLAKTNKNISFMSTLLSACQDLLDIFKSSQTSFLEHFERKNRCTTTAQSEEFM